MMCLAKQMGFPAEKQAPKVKTDLGGSENVTLLKELS